MKENSEYLQRAAAAVAGLEKEKAGITAAAKMMADAALEGRLVHIFGVDSRAADIEGEIFFRAGGLACIDPLYDPAFANSHGAYRSELCRPLDGLTPRILDYYERIEQGDPMLLLAFDQNSLALAQAAKWCGEHGLRTVAIVPEPPADGRVTECIDTVISFGRDTENERLCMTAALDAISAEAVELAPGAEVWKGDFFPDLEANRETVDSYLWRVRHL